MQISEKRTLREEVEDFLYEEAALLDEWRLDEWLELFTEEARYLVPTTDLPEGDPKQDMVFIDDDIVRLRARVGSTRRPARGVLSVTFGLRRRMGASLP